MRRLAVMLALWTEIALPCCRHGGAPAEDSAAASALAADSGASRRQRAARHRAAHNARIHDAWVAMGVGTVQTGRTARAAKFPVGCRQSRPGGVLEDPPELFSVDGALRLTLSYQTSMGDDGNARFCYVMATGGQNPTLHVRPGDVLHLKLRNDTAVPTTQATMAMAMGMPGTASCGAGQMLDATTNLHFHGTNTPPVCHQDEVLRTMVNPGETFDYHLEIPRDEPPGLCWYHPHIHGLAEAAVQGGASGALVVEGIQRLSKAARGLPQRVIVLRDQLLPAAVKVVDGMPAWNISVNGTPILHPDYQTPTAVVHADQPEFWRVVNAAADAMFDLQVVFDGAPQTLQIAALDGVATESLNGSHKGIPINVSHVVLAPGNRAEFILPAVPPGVKLAQLVTQEVDTGPDGDANPARPLVTLTPTSGSRPVADQGSGLGTAVAAKMRFADLDLAPPTVSRKLYFSSVDRGDDTDFFIVVDGQAPKLYDSHLPPAITTRQGAVEEWVIENRTGEIHSFHIHQIHFLPLERNGVPIPRGEQQFLDVINIPYWAGSGPYPSVKLRMDFRGPIAGDFVYHCHILEHEDKGMMATIRVLPQ